MSAVSSASPRSSADSSATRNAIREAATALFAERGFSQASVRDIAKRAGANQALVIRYFGSKEALFIETMSTSDRFAGLADPPLEMLGRTIVERLVRDPDGTAWRFYTALMRAVDRPDVRAHLLRATTTRIVEPLTERLQGANARVRAHLIAAQIIGLLNELWILEDPELVETDPEMLIDLYSRSIQTLVDTPATDQGAPSSRAP